jgi:hypothetical protein
MEGPPEIFVDKDNAFQGRCREKTYDHLKPLPTDHSGMVKLARYDPNLQRVIDAMKPVAVDPARLSLSRIASSDSGCDAVKRTVHITRIRLSVGCPCLI